MTIPHEIPLIGTPMSKPKDAATELARLWLVDGLPTFLINSNLWENPEMWGIFLSDLVDHVANAYQKSGYDRSTAIQKIVAGFNAERENPTSSADSL